MRHDTREYTLIAAALTGNSRPPGPGWDWDRTIAIAAREEVLPTLHAKLSCPPEVSDFLEVIHELNAERNRQLLSEVETLALLLNQAGLEPVLLKGAAYLVAEICANPADRFVHDIDFLMRVPQSAESFEIIRRAGYKAYLPNPAALVYHHHPMLTRVHHLPVEVHHSLGLGACATFLTADEVVDASTPSQLGRAVVRIPSPEHLMTHLIMHSQIHHGPNERIWPTLRAMNDLVLLGRRFLIDWESIRSRFRCHRRTSLLNLHLIQLEKALGIPPPFPISVDTVRWCYRRLLWLEPRLRYVDPIYTISRMVLPRIRLSWRLLKHPTGRRFLLSIPFRRSFYRKLLDDLARG